MACDITGRCMHLTGLCMHILHALHHDIIGQCMQLLHGLCCFDFVSDLPLSPATLDYIVNTLLISKKSRLFTKEHLLTSSYYKVEPFWTLSMNEGGKFKSWRKSVSTSCCSHWQQYVKSWTNFSLHDKPWAEFSTLEVAACIPCTYCPV